MDIHTLKDYNNSTTVKTSFYTEKIKTPTEQKTIKMSIRQWIKKMLPIR